ncbi:MAG: hypothetical protein IPL62_07075 [Caulobacteraceae bacterium]|nr:hypothetical protein [Caulobacteraceae bacterium]
MSKTPSSARSRTRASILWTPAQIGGLPQEGEPSQYWLSEGFTDFYTARMLVRGGSVDAAAIRRRSQPSAARLCAVAGPRSAKFSYPC